MKCNEVQVREHDADEAWFADGYISVNVGDNAVCYIPRDAKIGGTPRVWDPKALAEKIANVLRRK
jgi:hypothetical protein